MVFHLIDGRADNVGNIQNVLQMPRTIMADANRSSLSSRVNFLKRSPFLLALLRAGGGGLPLPRRIMDHQVIDVSKAQIGQILFMVDPYLLTRQATRNFGQNEQISARTST